MKIAIGIVSYLPDNEIRNIRIQRLNNLLRRCDKLFGLPIIIIAQNWKDSEIVALENSEIVIYSYKKGLGITEARRALREKFLASEYDYLIMLDDDIELAGNKEDANKYINQIESHPNMYGIFKQLTLQLFAISKEVYSLIDFPKLEPANGDYFEDMYLIMALNKLYSNKKFVFIRNSMNPIGCATDTVTSTWYAGQERHKMGDNTRRLISEL